MQSGDTLFANQGAATYQWYFNGSLIPGATDYFYVAMQNGDYNIICTDQNGCEVESAAFGVMVGIESIIPVFASCHISPNPVSAKLHIKLDGPGVVNRLSIYNVMGENVIGIPAYQFSDVDCSRLAQGIY